MTQACLFLAFFLWAAVPAMAQHTSTKQTAEQKAELVIDACLAASGGYAYLDSLAQNLYEKYSVVSNYNNAPNAANWRAVPEVTQHEVYQTRAGKSLSTTTHVATGSISTLGLNATHAWQVQDGTLLKVDTGLFFSTLQAAAQQYSCLVEPLRLHPSCRQHPLVWAREDHEANRAYDVLVDSSGLSVHEYWFDQQTHLLHKTVKGNGRMHHYTEDYRQLGQLWVPYKRRMVVQGQPANEIQYDSIAFPPHLPDSLFQLPSQFTDSKAGFK